ncbi:Uncharacterised protein [Cytobacillus firmus]|nr:Uncharacterised protein [Cytobacillus firmus]
MEFILNGVDSFFYDLILKEDFPQVHLYSTPIFFYVLKK